MACISAEPGNKLAAISSAGVFQADDRYGNGGRAGHVDSGSALYSHPLKERLRYGRRIVG